MTAETRASSSGMPAGERRNWSALIERRCGLALRAAQRPVLAEVLRSRMLARGVTTPESYYELLDAAPDGGTEWAAVTERLVSHETSFFRHLASFDAVRTRILPKLRRRPQVGANSLTLFSAGCSTGQEAYSLAMIAMEDDAIGGRFTVWGADISRRAIEHARRGQYTGRAIEGLPPRYRDRYLRVSGNGIARQYEVGEALRQRVRFVVSTLYPACQMFLTYDLILCQNVLIYLVPQAGEQLVASLAARLNLGGFLLLGPGEAPAHCPPGLEVVNIDGVRAFRRASRLAHEGRP